MTQAENKRVVDPGESSATPAETASETSRTAKRSAFASEPSERDQVRRNQPNERSAWATIFDCKEVL